MMKAGDRIRLTEYIMGTHPIGTNDYTVEEFRFCLGIFQSEQHRKAESFTPLCDIYDRGPDSENKYISNFGEYVSNLVPAFMNIPKPDDHDLLESATGCSMEGLDKLTVRGES
jgi:hypothetical protein